jgi:hypothetical protein
MTENQWAQMFRYVMGTGVMSVSFQDQLEQLFVKPGAVPLTINIESGASWIQGHYYQNDATKTLTIEPNPETGTRADLIVLECKWGLDAGITAKVIKGTAGVVWGPTTNRVGAMPPAPIQTYGVKWQLPLAQVNTVQNKVTVYIATDIIDWRTFVNSGGAKSSTYVVASDDASPLVRANADAQIPAGSVNAEQIINEAIDIVAGYGGGTVLLSEGTHDTSESISMQSNVNLKGLGKKTLIQYHSTAGTNNYPAIAAIDCDNVTIADLSIDGGGATLVDASPAAAVAGYDGIGINNGTFVSVRNCWIERCLNNGVNILSTDSTRVSSYGHRVEGCYMGDNRLAGIFLEANGGIFTTNQINHNGYGVYLYSDATTGAWGASINIINNNSIRFELMDGIKIKALTGKNAGEGNCSQNQIANNLISNPSQALTLTYSCIDLSGAYCYYNMITNNFLQSWQAPYALWAVKFDNLIAYNAILTNYLYSCGGHTTQATLIGGATPADTNRIKGNFITASGTPSGWE